MSCYQWERGTIKLPSAETVKIKNLLRTEQNRLREEMKATCIRIWKDVLKETRSQKIYMERLQAFEGQQYSRPPAYDYRGNQIQREIPHEVFWLLRDLANAPRQVQEKDLDRYYEKATNRTTSFSVGSEASISFSGNEVTWSVHENNRACETARGNSMGKAFFAALDRIQWTRGSGGEIVGNDEYNRDAEYAGGGGNYVTSYYGRLSGSRSRLTLSVQSRYR